MTQKEIELVIRLQHGDTLAFQDIYEIYYPRCKKQALLLCRNEADAHDMAQEALLKVYARIAQLKEPSYFDFWLRKIVHSQCISMFRHNQVMSYDPEILKTYRVEEKRIDHLPDSAYQFSDDQILVRELVGELKPKHSEILDLFYFQQLSINEISALTGLPSGTVKSRMFQAKRLLEQKIKNYERKQHRKIEFHIDPILPSIFTAWMLKLESSRWAKNVNLLKYAQIASVTTCVAATGVIVKEKVEEYQKDHNPPIVEQVKQEPIQKQASPSKPIFTPVTFRQQDITSPKNAYYALIAVIPIEADFSTISNSTIVEVKSLVDALRESKTRYWNLLEESGWLAQYIQAQGE